MKKKGKWWKFPRMIPLLMTRLRMLSLCRITSTRTSLITSTHSLLRLINELIRRSTRFLELFLKKHESINEFPKTHSFPKLEMVTPELEETLRMNKERLGKLDVNSTGFLWPEEEKLFNQIMWLNRHAITFEEDERGTLKESYFTPYIIPTIPHKAWEYKYLPEFKT